MSLASVIVPARDAAATLPGCLDALAAEGVPGPGVELLVVDDGSRDATAALAARPGVRVLRGPGRGPAAARNLGARAARGTVLVFLDADTAPCSGWFEALLAPLADSCVVAVKGRYYTCQPALVARFAQLEFEEKYARLARASRVDFVDAGTAAFRRDAFLAAGGFDEGFPAQSAEDVELAFRLADRGAHFAFAPRAGVLHRHADRLAPYLRKKARYGYYRVRVYRRFPAKALGDSYTPPLMALQIALAGATSASSLLAGLGVPGASRCALATLAALGLTTAPLMRRAAAGAPALVTAPLMRQPGRGRLVLAAAVPPLVFARAFAQGVGIAAGLAAPVRERVRGRRTDGSPAPA